MKAKLWVEIDADLLPGQEDLSCLLSQVLNDYIGDDNLNLVKVVVQSWECKNLRDC